METSELLEIIGRGEDGKHQFKANISNGGSLAAEIVAFSNSGGGQIFIGVNDDGTRSGLTAENLTGKHGLNQLISSVASDQVKPAVNVSTENIKLLDGLVVVVSVQDGISKPYFDNAGVIWVKSGADKRKVTSREEMQRMFQKAGLVHGDEIAANGVTTADIDLDYFRRFYQAEYGEELAQSGIPLPQLLENMNLASEGVLNIAGSLLFSRTPNVRLPAFIVKAVAFPGTTIEESNYLDSKDLTGKIADIFQKTINFIISNLRSVQGEGGFNTLGEAEIPREALEELVANALIHRDYFISAPIRVFVFQDRVEIISPGHLPNNLTIQNVLKGNSNIRNPILASFATRILPYRGLGSGIRRAIKAYPQISLVDDREGNLFIVTLSRR